jgi:hypothetical protein
VFVYNECEEVESVQEGATRRPSVRSEECEVW